MPSLNPAIIAQILSVSRQPSSGASGPTWVLRNFTKSSSGGSTSITVPATAAGATLIVCIIASGDTDDASSITDNGTGGANTYSKCGINYRASATGDGSLNLWFSIGNHSATTIIETGIPGSNVNAMAVWEVTGLNATAPFDTSNVVNNGGATTTPLGASVTTSATGDFIAAACLPNHSITGQAGGNEFSYDGTDAATASGYSHITSTSATAGAHQPQWNENISGQFASCTVAFKL